MDYPRTLAELEKLFSDEQACRDYLFSLRWPDGFRCPKCSHDGYWPTRRLLECRKCGHQTTVTAGTIFQDTRKPLPDWFRAIWYVTSQKNGASAWGVQRVLGLGSYLTAWCWLHKLRRAMVRHGRDRLKGEVEVDEVIVGGMEEGVHGRQFSRKRAMIAVAAERDGKKIGRIRMQRIDDGSSTSLHDFIHAHVEEGSIVHTDAWLGYRGLSGYTHRVVVIKNRKRASELLPGVHRVASLLKRWLLGTHQGAVSPAHLDYYLDEFTFRFNRRTSHSRGLLFYRLLQQAAVTDPAPYDKLNQHVRTGPEWLKYYR
jgi:transposase-like protein